MNLIEIVIDTLRASSLGCYGNAEVRTPSLDGLAAHSVLFEEAYAEMLPTIPARRVLYTGRRAFPSHRVFQADDGPYVWRGWHQLFDEDVTLAETLRQAGYTTALITDLYHQFKPGKNFHRGFDCCRFIRGQEADRLETGPWQDLPGDDAAVRQYLINRRDWQTDDDWFTAQLFRMASEWLADNHQDNQPFYLHVESFSPHEFWDPPEDYYRLYGPSGYTGRRIVSPPQFSTALSALELEHVRALYHGFVTFVDSRLGQFLDKMDGLGLADNTVVALVADHGTMLGEKSELGKGESRLRTQLTHIPLIVHDPRLPEAAGRRIKGMVQHPDLMPTVLDLLGVASPSRVTGSSLRPLMETGQPSTREVIFSGWNDHGAVRTKDWLYINRWNPGDAFEDIYDLASDPLELNNILGERPNERAHFRTILQDYVDSGWSITEGTFTQFA